MFKLSGAIIRAFIGPLLLNFIIWMLILDMQSLWLYVDDLMGKGLEWSIIMELMFYFSANWVPVALPLSILLASIMTLGKLGENNELTAMKSAGMSMFRIIRPLFVFMLFVSAFAFYFSNNLWPMANFNLRILISDIQDTKASIIFKEGVFVEQLEGFSIRVGEKIPEDNSFRDVFIRDYSGSIVSQYDNNVVYRDYKRTISARKGKFLTSADRKYMVVQLEDGVMYNEMNPKDVKDTKIPFTRYYFKKTNLKIKLQSFDLERTDKDRYSTESYMLTLDQIVDKRKEIEARDSVTHNQHFLFFKNVVAATRIYVDSTIENSDTINIIPSDNYFNKLTPAERKVNLMDAKSKLENKLLTVEQFKSIQDITNRDLTGLEISMHEKFTLSYAVLMLFFLGASFGAIIKKGGFGVPVLIAVFIFLAYFMLTTSGQELAKEGVLSPVLGMWMSSIILTPITIFITVKANNDSKIFDLDFYKKWFRKKK